MTVGDSVREIRMTKKQRKRIIVKKLEAVLLGIILGAASVPTATLAVVRTESKYSAVEQTAAAATGFEETEQTEKGMATVAGIPLSGSCEQSTHFWEG